MSGIGGLTYKTICCFNIWEGRFMKLIGGTLDEFIERVRGKRNVYCFGAGKALDYFLEAFDTYHLEEYIRYIVDNSIEKIGTVKKCMNREIKIISPRHMLQLLDKDEVILITTAKYAEVIEQLSKCEKLESVECYVYHLLRIEQENYDREQAVLPEQFTAKGDICIPKIIHYCWFGGSKIPEQNRRWMESWRKYCPDYQIIEWNEDNYDISKNLYMKQAYERGKWAFVSDYARVDVIVQYGGVYLDTDVELIKNIDPLLRNEAFCGFESKQYINFGLGFGAVKNHNIIKKVRDDYQRRQFILEGGKLNLVACPLYQTELLEKYGLKKNGQFQLLEGMTIYPERVLCPKSYYSFKIMKNLEYSYGIHHFAASWV